MLLNGGLYCSNLLVIMVDFKQYFLIKLDKLFTTTRKYPEHSNLKHCSIAQQDLDLRCRMGQTTYITPYKAMLRANLSSPVVCLVLLLGLGLKLKLRSIAHSEI